MPQQATRADTAASPRADGHPNPAEAHHQPAPITNNERNPNDETKNQARAQLQ